MGLRGWGAVPGGQHWHVCGLLDKKTNTGRRRPVMYSQSLIHTPSKPRNVSSVVAVRQLADMNSAGEREREKKKNPTDVFWEENKKHGWWRGQKEGRGGKTSFSRGLAENPLH